MVKRSRLLERTELEEGAPPYAETDLARRAAKARPRLAILAVVGAAGFGLEAALARDPAMALGAILLALAAFGVWRGRLGAVVAVALASALAIFVPLALFALGGVSLDEGVPMAFAVVWGALLVPDVILLFRDAELQYAYGMWARRAR